MKLIKMKFILALIFICNITSLQGQLDEGLPFYNTFNDQLLNAKLSFADSKKDVESVYIVSGDDGSESRLEERATLSSTTRWRNKPWSQFSTY